MNSKPLLALFALLIVGTTASAFPETIRYNYKSCGSCHVSPAGGGVLTDYGKMTGAEMATWSFEGEGRSDYGLLEDNDYDQYLNIGGDIRYLWAGFETLQGDQYLAMPMQRDIEVAVHIAKNLTVASSAGLYGKKGLKEYRRHYLLYKPMKGLSVRLGRFIPAYGIMTPDHTAVTRQRLAFGQGTERYNAEVAYVDKSWELFVTGSMGNEISTEGSAQHALRVKSEAERSTTVRAAYYLGDSSLVGASYYFGRRGDFLNRFGGLFASYAVTPTVYGNVDVTFRPAEDKKWQEQSLYRALTGWEYWKGAHARYILEWDNLYYIHTAEAVWFPRPHWELLGQYKMREDLRQWSLVLHYYL